MCIVRACAHMIVRILCILSQFHTRIHPSTIHTVSDDLICMIRRAEDAHAFFERASSRDATLANEDTLLALVADFRTNLPTTQPAHTPDSQHTAHAEPRTSDTQSTHLVNNNSSNTSQHPAAHGARLHVRGDGDTLGVELEDGGGERGRGRGNARAQARGNDTKDAAALQKSGAFLASAAQQSGGLPQHVRHTIASANSVLVTYFSAFFKSLSIHTGSRSHNVKSTFDPSLFRSTFVSIDLPVCLSICLLTDPTIFPTLYISL